MLKVMPMVSNHLKIARVLLEGSVGLKSGDARSVGMVCSNAVGLNQIII